jgi:hypothetical protein
MTSDRRDTPLGYKNPPSWSRFQKGKSGNPNGRPKKKASQDSVPVQQSDLDEILRAEFERTISVSDAGSSKQMNMLQVVAKAQLKAAATGNVTAQRDIVRQARELERRDAERAIMAKQKAELEQKEKIETYKRIEIWKRSRGEQYSTDRNMAAS